MHIPPPHPNALHRLAHEVSSSALGAKVFSYLFHHLDAPVLRASNGRASVASFFTGLPIVLLTTTGAKSGKPRAIPLLAFPDGEKIFLIGSNWGGKKYPAWIHNLRAQPRATVTYGGETKTFVAREPKGAEYERYWQRAVDLYKGYALYKTRAGGREIPIVVLE